MRDARYYKVTTINSRATYNEELGDYIYEYDWDDDNKCKVLLSSSYVGLMQKGGFFKGEICEGGVVALNDVIQVKLIEYYDDIDVWLAKRVDA